MPVFAYGFVLLFSAIAYFILQNNIIKYHDEDFILGKVIGSDLKGKISIIIYTLGIIFSFLFTWISIICYIAVAVLWIIPDNRIEKNLD